MQRIQIASDVATGLNYLHSFANPSHDYKDIKSNNILLDGDFRAKIANFGLARSTQGQLEGQFSMTKHIVGNFGYIAPDYLEIGLVSKKLRCLCVWSSVARNVCRERGRCFECCN